MSGIVYLVGAGPGDSGLITVKGMEVLKKADVIIYDHLVNPLLLKHAGINCEKIYVGKSAGNHTLTQDKINELIIMKAQEEKNVVRLKGGDPYVFGRGGEEGEELNKAGIQFEVVPGITSAIGGLAYGGIPITHRECASSFHVITGHRKENSEEINWDALANLQGTKVFLMGVKNLSNICDKLLQGGQDGHTPVAIIHRATTPYQKVIEGNLKTIVEIAQQEKIKPPSLIVVGNVVDKREALNFFEKQPLFGKKIIVTRSRAQNSNLLSTINSLGGLGIEMPTINIQPINQSKLLDSMDRIKEYNYIVFTSTNGVDIFFDQLYNRNLDARALGKIKVVAIGKGTEDRLLSKGIRADFVPSSYVGEGIVEMLKDIIRPGDKVLLPRSQNARPYLYEALSKLCLVTEIHTYRAEKVEEDYSDIIKQLKENEIDYITFTSSSTVENFISCINGNIDLLRQVKIISIGPITSSKIMAFGLEVYKEAKTFTIDGIIEILKDDK